MRSVLNNLVWGYYTGAGLRGAISGVAVLIQLARANARLVALQVGVGFPLCLHCDLAMVALARPLRAGGKARIHTLVAHNAVLDGTTLHGAFQQVSRLLKHSA